jgi:UDP-N-acetylmuramoyl-L-alanyl-D-glutamate--2,6-diaminopimelate ligase
MNLKQILQDINYTVLNGSDSTDIGKIEYDSRKIKPGDAFFCIQGFNMDGHKFIDSAVKNGAVAVVCQRKIDNIPNCTIIQVDDTREALALSSANFYDHPAKKMKLIGLTGTNGKTTSTYLIKSILEQAGYKVGLIGTIANYIGNKRIDTHRTTPESLELHSLFREMVDEETDYCIMEVSSHSLVLKRVFGITFAEAIFTNLTQDHLDFHKTFENYYAAKLILFKNSQNSIINIDDTYGRRVYDDAGNNRLTYSIDSNSDIKAENIVLHSRGVEFDIVYNGDKERITLSLPGKYNIMNALGCAGACLNEGIPLSVVKKGLENMLCVPGRCEIVTKNYNLGFDIIVDYAHTPDGLENILKTAREFTKGRLISVFGCGGDRDRTKRPIMGRIGSNLSDFAVITSDNPRSEEPFKIIKDILSGISKDNYMVVGNRKEAIRKAIEMAKMDDVIVVAGKGHEDYQILKDKTIHFDEREIIAEIINELRIG